MLRSLSIDNLVVIRHADVAFGEGLTALTGETGAGKSVFFTALTLLCGAKADAALVGPDGEEAYVQAELDLPAGLLDDEELQSIRELQPADEPGIVLGRRVTRDGRSRGYVWGRAVARDDLAAIAERLIGLSGQFEQRRLAKPSYQLTLLDASAGEEQSRRLSETRKAWRALQAERKTLREILASAEAGELRRAELERLVELSADIEQGEDILLRAERAKLVNVQDIALAAAAAAEALAPEDGDGAADLAGSAERQLEHVAEYAPEISEALAEITSAGETLRDAAATLRSYLRDLEADPARLDEIEARLSHLEELKRRFRAVTLDDLLQRAEQAADELHQLEATSVEQAQQAAAAAEERYLKLAGELRAARKKAAKRYGKQVQAELALLGMGDAGIQVELADAKEGPTGADKAAFLVCPNPGLPFQPLAETASGGELSRIALALRVAAHSAEGEPTLVFDEIDAGIGGKTAHAVAESLTRLAATTQVLTITHLPQIASAAAGHLAIEKLQGTTTETTVRSLAEAERKQEIERMLGGADFLAAIGKDS